MIDITNEILTDIKLELEDVNVISPTQSKVSSFPTVTIREIDNSSNIGTKDTGGFQHSNIAYEIDIYTRGTGRMSKAKNIRNRINEIIQNKYGMARGTPSEIPNYLDESIYRYRLTYSGLIDKRKKIYRG